MTVAIITVALLNGERVIAKKDASFSLHMSPDGIVKFQLQEQIDFNPNSGLCDGWGLLDSNENLFSVQKISPPARDGDDVQIFP